jgi:ribosome-binding protein aMBF1 (putative translation factor)
VKCQVKYQAIFAYADFACTVGYGDMPDTMPKSVFTKRYKIFRDELEKARRQAGMSQEQLAKQLGWDQTYVSKIERGVRRVDIVELVTICDAIGIDPARFVKRLHQQFGKA